MSTDPSCGGKNNDGSYGGCTTECKYGPYCGDGVHDAANGEECDLGSRDNNVTYGSKDGCAPGCKFPHFCGDAMVDEAEGEQCDLGPNNGTHGRAVHDRLQGLRRLSVALRPAAVRAAQLAGAHGASSGGDAP